MAPASIAPIDEHPVEEDAIEANAAGDHYRPQRRPLAPAVFDRPSHMFMSRSRCPSTRPGSTVACGARRHRFAGSALPSASCARRLAPARRQHC